MFIYQMTRKMKDKEDQISVIQSKQGISVWDVNSPSSLVRYLCRPTDPASLAILRIAFGKIALLTLKSIMMEASCEITWN